VSKDEGTSAPTNIAVLLIRFITERRTMATASSRCPCGVRKKRNAAENLKATSELTVVETEE
jgi:hypothetical protein